jgi:hypothetical protein
MVIAQQLIRGYDALLEGLRSDYNHEQSNFIAQEIARITRAKSHMVEQLGRLVLEDSQ